MLRSHVHRKQQVFRDAQPFNQVASRVDFLVLQLNIARRSLPMLIFRSQCHRSRHLNGHQFAEWIFDSHAQIDVWQTLRLVSSHFIVPTTTSQKLILLVWSLRWGGRKVNERGGGVRVRKDFVKGTRPDLAVHHMRFFVWFDEVETQTQPLACFWVEKRDIEPWRSHNDSRTFGQVFAFVDTFSDCKWQTSDGFERFDIRRRRRTAIKSGSDLKRTQNSPCDHQRPPRIGQIWV